MIPSNEEGSMADNKQIVQQWFDCIARNDTEGLFALFADDIVYHLKGTMSLSGSYRGKQSIAEDFFIPWRKQIDGNLIVTVDELIGEGDRVVALGRGKAKTIFGLPYNNDYAFVFRVRNGKIAEVIEYLDTVLVETAAYGRKLV
jgi:ketosteroid isomerase-like protein